MKNALLLCFLFFLTLFGAPSQCPKFYMDGEAPIILNEKLSPKTPLWSAEYITREAIDVKLPRKDNFREDDRLSKQKKQN